MEPSSPEQIPPHPFERRVSHYQSQAERLLNRHTRDFTEFTRGNEGLVARGDELLRTYEATGYNILRRYTDMPLTSRRPLMFYSNYIGRPRHFGLLLSIMERDGIITPDQVRFGAKASKVLYGGWDIDEQSERIVDIQREDAQGSASQDQVDETVETVITFTPRNNTQAADIALFLNRRARRGEPEAIEDSWDVPDMRATVSLRDALREVDFEEVLANIFVSGQARLVVARQQTAFPRPWRATPIEVNSQLATYLAIQGVPS